MLKTFNFKLSELFEIQTTISQNKNAITFNENGKYDFIGRTATNYGIQGYLDKQSFEPNPAKTFSLVQVGESVCLYRENEWYASQNIFILKPKFNKITETHLYIQTLINKQLSVYSSAYNYPTLPEVKNIIILLPVIENSNQYYQYTVNDIDWQYMSDRIEELEADRIEELEADRIEELEAYLSVTGLDNYELTEEDKEVLGHKPEMHEFILNDIFYLENGNKLDKNKMSYVSPSINFVSRTANNNGVSDIVDKINGLVPYSSGCLTLAFGGSIGSCFLQESPFYTGQNVGIIKFNGNVPNQAKLYVKTIIEKVCKNRFVAFGDEINKHFKTDLSITLPVIENPDKNHEYTIDDIDFDYMERYIRAIEKRAIASLYERRGKVIDITRMIVGRADY